MPHIDLLELPYFEGISMEGLVALVDLMRPHQFPEGHVIVQEGERGAQPLYIATSGKIMITKIAPGGHQRNLADLESPTLFGEIELFCQIPPVCSARALTNVSAFSLDRPTFDSLFGSHDAPAADTIPIIAIWGLQVALILVGHIYAIIIAHKTSITLYEKHRQAVFSQIPMLVAMLLFSFQSLWLIAQPMVMRTAM